MAVFVQRKRVLTSIYYYDIMNLPSWKRVPAMGRRVYGVDKLPRDSATAGNRDPSPRQNIQGLLVARAGD